VGALRFTLLAKKAKMIPIKAGCVDSGAHVHVISFFCRYLNLLGVLAEITCHRTRTLVRPRRAFLTVTSELPNVQQASVVQRRITFSTG